MPKLSVWMIRAALIYLGIGFTFGALMLSNKAIAYAPVVWRLLGSHIEMLMFGWTAQLAMGAAFWIMPRFSVTERRYGDVRPAWAAFALLNAGVLLVAAADVTTVEALRFAGRVLELLAVIAFARHVWPRVKPFGT